MTTATLYVLVTCTLEQTRFDMLSRVVENMKFFDEVKDSFVVFDNASTFPGSTKLLEDNFKIIIKSSQNVGFWTAIDYVMQHSFELTGKTFDFINVIESDMLYTPDVMKRLADCESFLRANDDIGFIRTEEFSVKKRHIYDKRNPHVDSKRYAWVSQENFIEKNRVWFKERDEISRIYASNFLAKVPVFARLPAMKAVFDELRKFDSFDEMTYQKLFYDLYPTSGVLDGGVWESRMGNENPQLKVTGSWSHNNTIGYKQTRVDKLVDVKSDILQIVKRT